MAATTEFYLDQAARCADAAQKSGLQNEKERNLRSQAAWQALADRLIRSEASRQTAQAEKMRAEAAGESAPDEDD